MLNTVFASSGLIVCMTLALHMALRPPQQAWLERLPRAVMRWLNRMLLWRLNTRERRRAARMEAMEAIQRARRHASDEGLWEGNIYRPKKFEQPHKPH